MKILRVAFPKVARREFDYLLPSHITNVALYCRVRAPFRQTSLIGIIVKINETSDFAINKLKPIVELVDQQPLLTEDVVQLCEWASNYYHYPLGDILFTAIPKRLRDGRDVKVKIFEKINVSENRESILDLNEEQITAVNTIGRHLDKHQVFLLEGVTGSGKTEVYLRLIKSVLNSNKQCLVLVPEIGLTPQTVARFQQRFNVAVSLLHSGLNDTERCSAWMQAKEGIAKIIIGTRSAVFTPLPQLGLIIIDEEHDSSFKQQDSFRYSARDLAIVRAKELGIPVILGSATPSLESFYNARLLKRYHLLILSRRAGEALRPDIHIIDTRTQRLQKGLSSLLIEKIKRHLEQNNQVLMFINRRGYAPVVMCYHCGWLIDCKQCDAHLTLHHSPRYLMCHHCGDKQTVIDECAQCKSKTLSPVGVGTEKVEEFLANEFPNAEIIRIDRDSTSRKGVLQNMLETIQAGGAKILIGTQMLAKGHHFPNVTLVGILNADNGFFSNDFRATERLGQLLIQVAGRAGRADKKGEVYIQTHHPDHPLLKQLLSNGYIQFADSLLAERRTVGLPPFGYLVLFRSHAKVSDDSFAFLKQITEWCESHKNNIQLFGPVSSPMAKRAGQFHNQLLIQASDRKALQILLKEIIPKLYLSAEKKRLLWSVDVDPIELF